MSITSFEALPLAAPLQRALRENEYTVPSPIQAQAIPSLIEGRDLLGCAQTGTGKTAAFVLPTLQRLSESARRVKSRNMRCLVLTPTRELAVQVAESFQKYGKHIRFSLATVYGGVGQGPQVRALARGLDVLVATPGRLLDLKEQGHLELGEVEVFVLDEADRMLDMGFINDMRKIVREIPSRRQTLFFSATISAEITRLAATMLSEPVSVNITPSTTTAEKIEHSICFLRKADKAATLLNLVREQREAEGEGLTLVFSKTKHGASRLARNLDRDGILADAIHGNKSQAARQKALEKFRTGRTRVLVATDVAARGIDVKNIALVINYDLPNEAESYVHRIGRTARAGAEGRALSFCGEEEFGCLRDIEKLIRQEISVHEGHTHHAGDIADAYSRSKQSQASGRGGRSSGGSSRGHGPRNSGGRRSGGRGNSRRGTAQSRGRN